MHNHFHLIAACIEAVIGFILSVFMPKVALVLLIPVIYVPTLQGMAACATITLVAYTIIIDQYRQSKKKRR